MKTARVCVVGGAEVVCKVSQESILALSPHLVLSKGIGWLFGRCIRLPTILAQPDMRCSFATQRICFPHRLYLLLHQPQEQHFD